MMSRLFAMRIVDSPLVRRTLWRIGRGLYRFARFEQGNEIGSNGERMVQDVALRNATRDCCDVFDVGANVGDWTEPLVLHPGFERSPIRVHAFEPVPSTRASFTKRIHNDRVRVHALALSDRDGETRMSVFSSERSGINSLLTSQTEPNTTVVEVALRKMDSFVREENIASVLLVKCDAEGHDLFVIRGAKGLLQEGKVRIFQFEYNARWVQAGVHLRDVFVEVADLPYVVGKVLPEGVEVYPEWHFELEHYFEGNYLLIHRDALRWFNARECRFDDSNRPVVTAVNA